MSKVSTLDAETELLLRQWRVNRSHYWRWENYDAALVERGLVTLFRSWKWRERIRSLADMHGLRAATEEHAILQDATQVIAELLGASEGKGVTTVRTRA